jgi:hypothetical protein
MPRVRVQIRSQRSGLPLFRRIVARRTARLAVPKGSLVATGGDSERKSMKAAEGPLSFIHCISVS